MGSEKRTSKVRREIIQGYVAGKRRKETLKFLDKIKLIKARNFYSGLLHLSLQTSPGTIQFKLFQKIKIMKSRKRNSGLLHLSFNIYTNYFPNNSSSLLYKSSPRRSFAMIIPLGSSKILAGIELMAYSLPASLPQYFKSLT